MSFSVQVPINCRCVHCGVVAPIRPTVLHRGCKTGGLRALSSTGENWEVVSSERPEGWVSGDLKAPTQGYCEKCVAHAPTPAPAVAPPAFSVPAAKASEVFLKAPTERVPAAIPSAPERAAAPPPMSNQIIPSTLPSTIRTTSAPLASNPTNAKLTPPSHKVTQNRVFSSPGAPITPNVQGVSKIEHIGVTAKVTPQIHNATVAPQTRTTVNAASEQPAAKVTSTHIYKSNSVSTPTPIEAKPTNATQHTVTVKPATKSFPNSTPAVKHIG